MKVAEHKGNEFRLDWLASALKSVYLSFGAFPV